MKIKLTSRLRKRYPNISFRAILIKNIKNKKTNPRIEAEKLKLEKAIKKNSDLKTIERLQEQGSFHRSFAKSYPIEFQLKSVLQGKKIPTQSAYVDILFLAELKHYCIISGHDLNAIENDITFDLSDGGENYTKINNQRQSLKKDDIVLRENDQVITTLLYGPDASTKITENTTNCLYLFWFCAAISEKEIQGILKDFKQNLSLLKTKNTVATEPNITLESSPKLVITPWEVKGNIDYNKIVKEFGVSAIDNKLQKRIEKHTGPVHHFLRRNIFFAHRDLPFILDQYEKGNKFFLYTGRSPSNHTHMGHMIPWMFTKWLQDKFGVELWFQFPDEEKFLMKRDLRLDDVEKFTNENMLDVIALGFDPKKTHFLIDTRHANTMYKEAVRVAKLITYSTVRSSFGFTNEQNIGAIFYTAMQAVPAFLPSVLKKKKIPCLIPHAIDQDPHFRVTRDVIQKLGYYKPGSIQCRFLPGLGGMQTDGKMSSSAGDNSTIFTVDNASTVKKKINKHAFSGGQPTIEEHKKLGGDPNIDISYQWLTFFEEDDAKLKDIYESYKSGSMLSGELKAMLIKKLNTFLTSHQEKRQKAKKKIDQFVYQS